VPRSVRAPSAVQPARSSIVDVARLAGVSVATVSRALRNLPNVSAATRERVMRAAGELEYTASPLAAALVTGRTRSVGVLASAADRWFFAGALCGIERGLREFGYDTVLHVLPEDSRRDRFFEGLPVRRRVDALVLVGLHLSEPELSALRGLRVPLAGVAMRLPGVHTERIDNVDAARLAVRHLIDLGHTSIALIGGDDGSAVAERTRGARAALREAGLEPVGVEHVGGADVGAVGFTGRPGAVAMTRLLDAARDGAARRPTAVFCLCDEMAFGALHALQRAGLRCPEDVSVMGFDDHDLAAAYDLSTIAQPVEEQGAAAARWLGGALNETGLNETGLSELNERVPGDRVHPVQLRLRGTTGPVGG
jgi:LacI family transcriptional regulator, repressor for deo operon, udp, cdd, tsx, nupC, and nupG